MPLLALLTENASLSALDSVLLPGISFNQSINRVLAAPAEVVGLNLSCRTYSTVQYRNAFSSYKFFDCGR